MNLYQKIIEVRKAAGGLSKDKHGYDYDYVTGNQILSKVKDRMNELNLLLIPETKLGEWKTHTFKTQNGKEKTNFIVSGEMFYVWIDGDKPEDRLVVGWAYYGQQDDISKAYGSALTYSERYFWLKVLGLPTDDDDPDSRQVNGNGGKVNGQFDENAEITADDVPCPTKTASLYSTNKTDTVKSECEQCQSNMTVAQMTLSKAKFDGRVLCPTCQKGMK